MSAWPGSWPGWHGWLRLWRTRLHSKRRRSVFGEQGKIDLLTRQTDIVYPHAYAVTQTIGLARMLPYKAEAFRVKEKIIGQPADVYQTLDEEAVEFDEQPELHHTRDHSVVLLAQLIQHKFDFFEIFDRALGVIGEALTCRSGSSYLWQSLEPELTSCRRHAARSGAVTQQAVHDQVRVTSDGRGKVCIVRTGQAEVATVINSIMCPRQGA